jgi:ATP-binding cassette subfamily G (WHITE) protein 2 (PDR)
MPHVIDAAPGSHTNQDYNQAWLESEERKAVLDELDYMDSELVKKPYDNKLNKREFAAPMWKQILYVAQREF